MLLLLLRSAPAPSQATCGLIFFWAGTYAPPADPTSSGGNLATQDWTDALERARKYRVPVRAQAYAWHDHRAACWIHIRARVPVTLARHESGAFAYRPTIRSRISCELSPQLISCAMTMPRLRFRAQAAHNPPDKIRLGGPLPITDHEALLAIVAYKQRTKPLV